MKKNYLSILVAYNDDNITELLITIIDTRYNSKIDIAKYDSEFFEYTDTADYDVILMDNSFCKGAFSVIEKFRLRGTRKKTPIALFISHITEEDYKRAVDLDVFDFLSRPFSLDHIYLCLDYISHKKGYHEHIKNKRNSVRCDKRFFMRYYVKGSAKALNENGSMITTDDISLGGIKFSDKSNLLIDDEIDMEILLGNPYDSSKMTASGKVKWTKQNADDQFTTGVAFLNLSKSDEAKLRNTLYSK
jgi:DNA-binding response OmpR family regulator